MTTGSSLDGTVANVTPEAASNPEPTEQAAAEHETKSITHRTQAGPEDAKPKTLNARITFAAGANEPPPEVRALYIPPPRDRDNGE